MSGDNMQSTIEKPLPPPTDLSHSDNFQIFGFDPEKFSPPMRFTFHKNRDQEINDMQRHLQSAVSLELKTIPLYLYAAYSIITYGPASQSILAVVKQEMLHLALAGNILCSIGGTPILYRKKTETHAYVPEYPTTMVYQDITLNLKAATKNNIRTFMELERPEPGLEFEFDILEKSRDGIYGSIGAFYKAVESELVRINVSQSPFLEGLKDRQYKHGDGSWNEDNMIVVTDISSARAAIKTIVEQGEGSTRPARPPPQPKESTVEPTPPLLFKSHFEIFEEVYSGNPLKCYNLLENPRTEELSNNIFHPVLLFCDAAYCYLLITIENMWDVKFEGNRRDLVTNNLQNIMLHVLRPLAAFLVGKTYVQDDETFNLAPFFNFFEFNETSSCHQQLKAECEKAVQVDPKLQGLQLVVDRLIEVEARRP